LHHLGGNVVIADQNSGCGKALASELGSKAIVLDTDVSNDADGKACVQAALSHFERVHGLINCAGVAAAEKLLG
jgi:NAD(P)-dependent dehydrogenase (short-subunit alcohol dehydrogenase family)